MEGVQKRILRDFGAFMGLWIGFWSPILKSRLVLGVGLNLII